MHNSVTTLTVMVSLQQHIKQWPMFFVGPRSILWGHWLSLFWTSCDPPHGFQSQGGYLTCIFTYLCTVNLSVMSGTTPVFSTNRGCTLCKCVYSRPTFWSSLVQAVKGRQWSMRFDLGFSGCPLDKRTHYPLGHASWILMANCIIEIW